MSQERTLTLEKQIDLERFSTPAVTYRLSSHADEPLRLRVQEQIPERFQSTGLQFRAEDADNWATTDGTAVFEHRIEPGEEFSTLFGVRTDDVENLDAFAACPAVEVGPVGVQEPGTDWITVPREQLDFRGIPPEEQTSAERVMASDGGEIRSALESSSGASESENGDDGSAPSDSLESAIPPTSDLETTDREGSASENEQGTTEKGNAFDGFWMQSESTIVDDFITALREESLSAEQRQTLREAIEPDSAGSLNARIEHCQTRLSDLSAYTDALEEFLAEEGSGQELIEDFRSDLSAVEEQLAALESEVATTAAEQDELRARIDGIEREVSTLHEVESGVESLETRLDDSTRSLQEDIDTLRATVENLEEWQERVTGMFAGSGSAEER